MDRTVSAQIDAEVYNETQLELQVAVARAPGLEIDDELTITLDGTTLTTTEVPTPHGGMLHVVDGVGRGDLQIRYRAHVRGRAEIPDPDPYTLSVMRRPSRYATSDTLGGFAAREMGDVATADLPTYVASWVGTRLSYVPGSSGPSDGAAETLLAGQGVCRDYAHLVIAMLRSLGVPARLTAVYAPGCVPMDFHAVVEAWITPADGAGDGPGWYAVDATALAPRSTLLRIATGRDAADTAFLTNNGGSLWLSRSEVSAVADDGLPSDDVDQLVQLV